MQLPTTFVGVDVSKASLDAAVAGSGGRTLLANTSAAIDAWLAKLPAVAIIAAESTGPYHQLLVQRCQHAGRPVYVLNAKDVYFYAKGLGSRAKTDRLDAQVIARYLAEHHQKLHPCAPVSQAQSEVEKLLRQRALLVSKRVALRQSFQGCTVKQAILEIERGFKAAQQALDERIQQLIDADATLRTGQTLLRSITGFGVQISALLAVLLTRMNFSSSDALVAYSGLDPAAKDSGEKKGRRRLSKKGNPELRRAIWLAAFAACHSKALRPVYQSLRGRGFATTEALVILGRKLLRAAFAVWKTRQPFDAAKLGGVTP